MSDSDKTTDASILITTGTVYVGPDGGTTDEAFPKPDVEYDFCAGNDFDRAPPPKRQTSQLSGHS